MYKHINVKLNKMLTTEKTIRVRFKNCLNALNFNITNEAPEVEAKNRN